MYSTIDEAWNNDMSLIYANNFKQAKFNSAPATKKNYFTVQEYYSPKNNQSIQQKQHKQKKLSITKTKSKTSTTPLPKSIKLKKKVNCQQIFKHIKKCKKCRRKLRKYLNRNKIVIDMNPVEVRKMLLFIILVGMVIMLFNMLTESRLKRI